MAGETAVTYCSPDASRRRERPLATAWLLAFWTAGLAAAGVSASYALFLTTYPALVALVSFVYAFAIGGPLFLVTWFWLAATEAFQHRPFLVMALVWAGAWCVLAALDSIDPSARGVVLVFAWLPVLSCVVMLRLVVSARAREREHVEGSVRAT